MAKINISVDHKLGQAEALKRIKLFLENAPKQFSGEINGLKTNWNGTVSDFSFTFANVPVNGNLGVSKESITISTKIPFAMLLFKSKIEQVVRQYANVILK